MRHILNTSVPIPITFNSTSSPSVATYDKDVETGLALRNLWSHFVLPETMSLPNFWSLLPGGTTISVHHALECCLLDAKRGDGTDRAILLLVDETVKLTDAVPKAPLVSLIGSLLSNFASNKLNVVCTTLDAVLLRNEATATGRPLHWASLPIMRQADAEALMLRALGDAEHRHSRGTTHGSTVSSLPTAVRIAISDAAGHPRSLQYVLAAMMELHAGGGLQALGMQRGDHWQGGQPLQRLRDAALKRFTPELCPTFVAIQTALRGEELKLTAKPLGDSRDVRHLIAEGIFIKTDVTTTGAKPVTSVVPKLSMLRLLQFARGSYKNPRDQAVAACISQLAQVEAEGAAAEPSPHLRGDYFENFMTSWLRLIRLIRQGEPVSVLGLFHAEKLLHWVPSTAVHPSLTAQFVLKHTPDPSWLVSAETRKFSALVRQGKVGRDDVVAMFGDSNLAFGLLLTASCIDARRDSPCSHVAVAIETRMSRVGSATIDRDLEAKLIGFHKLSPTFASMSPAPAHVAYVYAAARKMKNLAMLQVEQAAKGVLLLADNVDGEQAPVASVRDALTPSLADRALFVLQLDTERRQSV